jgi:hypothetical protein
VSPPDRRAFLHIMRGLLDDSRTHTPTREQVVSVSSPIVRLVFVEMLTRWHPDHAAAFRKDVLNYMLQLYPDE